MVRYDAILDQSERAHLYNHLSNYTNLEYYTVFDKLYSVWLIKHLLYLASCNTACQDGIRGGGGSWIKTKKINTLCNTGVKLKQL